MRYTLLVVVACLALQSTVSAHDAIGSLILIPGSSLDSSDPSSKADETSLCLQPGWFVLATAASHRPVERAGYSLATLWLYGQMPKDDPWDTSAPISAMAFRSSDDRPLWDWKPFHLAHPRCYELRVVNGRARLYEWRIEIDWR